MLLSRLTIYNEIKNEEIRTIHFENGLNVISNNENENTSANGIGKTTLLALVNFCLGGKGEDIFIDHENNKNINIEARDFLERNEVLLTLVLIKKQKEIVINRNFLKGNKAIREINGESIKDKDFKERLTEILFDFNKEKPSFSWLKGHNFRYKNKSVENCIDIFDGYGNEIRYQDLFLFKLFGKDIFDIYNAQKIDEANKNIKAILNSITALKGFDPSKSESELGVIKNHILALEDKKSFLVLNENYEEDINHLSDLNKELKEETHKHSMFIYRKDLLEKTISELEKSNFDEDLKVLKLIYDEYLDIKDISIHKRFEDLVNYHNSMAKNKIEFLKSNLEEIKEKITNTSNWINKLGEEIFIFEKKFKESVAFEEYNQMILEINQLYEEKGKLEQKIEISYELEKNLEANKNLINDMPIFSDNFKIDLQHRVDEFNKFFTQVSQEVYGKDYFLSFELKTKKKSGDKYYQFKSNSRVQSSGEKQGEALCFDIACCLYAKANDIPHLSFILNDKKELLDFGKIEKVKEIVEKNNIQLVFPMLSDKINKYPELKKNIILKLSQHEKLFRF